MVKHNVFLASHNAGKQREFQHALGDNITVLTPNDKAIPAVAETGLSYIENALIKARHAARLVDCPVIADDSGLSVDALEGAPGIYSARYAGPDANDADNLAKLLHALQTVPDGKRQAQFHCVIAFLRHANDPCPELFHGIWHGTITHKLHGQGGFGYDPVFYIEQQQCTAAELAAAQKNHLSHRGQAMQQFLQFMHQHYPS